MSWSEDRLHRWLARRGRSELLAGSPQSDAAVLRRPAGREVVCVDACIEGVHAEYGVAGRALGRKAACRALSDLAATAATPRALLLSLSAPREREERWLRAAIEGVEAAGREAGAALVGGDLAALVGGPAILAVTALGELGGRRRAPGRDRARPGEQLVLTGPVGGSGLGRHLRPRPRLDLGRALHQAGATAMMDVSDGLAWDLYRLARTSGVRLELEHVPLHRDARRAARVSGRSPLDHGLHDGEDYELVATLPSGARLPEGCERIGSVRRGEGLWLGAELCAALGGEAKERPWQPSEGGWRHGEW